MADPRPPGWPDIALCALVLVVIVAAALLGAG